MNLQRLGGFLWVNSHMLAPIQVSPEDAELE